MPHIAVITRASRDREDTRISCDRQHQRCIAKANDLWPGVETVEYRDNNASGADPAAKRPALERFWAALRAGEVAQVVAHEQSRITRQPDVWQKLCVALSLAGIEKVYTVNGDVLSVDPGNRLVGSLLNLIDAEEVERTKTRVRAAHDQLAKEGRPSGGRQYGYDCAVGADRRATLTVNDAQAAIIRDIAARLIEGHSATSIMRDLNASGIAAPTGKAWYLTTLKGIISRPTVAGLRVHHGKIVGKGIWAPILDEQTWRKAVKALGGSTVIGADGAMYNAPRKIRPNGRKWLLTGGLARCAVCGGRMTVIHSADGRPSYSCHKSVNETACGKVAIFQAPEVEDFVRDEVFAAAEKSSKLRKRLANDPDPKRAKLHAEIDDLEDRVRIATRSFLATGLSGSELEEVTADTTAKIAKARAALAALPDSDIELPPYHEIRARWDEMPLRQRRAFIERAVSSIEIRPALVKGPMPGQDNVTRLRTRIKPIWRA